MLPGTWHLSTYLSTCLNYGSGCHKISEEQKTVWEEGHENREVIFPNMDWLVGRQSPISPWHTRMRAAAKPGDFQPQLIHTQQPIFQVVCGTPETLNAKYSDTQEAVLQLELRKPHGNRKLICANLKALIYQEHIHTHTRIQLGSCTEV